MTENTSVRLLVILSEDSSAAEEQVTAPDIPHGNVRSLTTEMEDRTRAYVRQQSKLHVPTCHDDNGSQPSYPKGSLLTWGTPSGQPDVDPSTQNAAILHEAPPRPPVSPFPARGTDRDETKPQVPNVVRSAQPYTSHRHTNHDITPMYLQKHIRRMAAGVYAEVRWLLAVKTMKGGDWLSLVISNSDFSGCIVTLRPNASLMRSVAAEEYVTYHRLMGTDQILVRETTSVYEVCLHVTHRHKPVPPPSATWYPGPRYRSYADALRQPARRWFRPHYGEQDIPPRMTTVQIQDRIQSPREPARKRTVATMTGEAEDQPLQPTDWHQPPLTSPPPSPPGPPRGQRHGRRTRGTVVTEDSFLQDEPEQQDEVRVMEEPPHTPTHLELEAPFDELQAEEEAAAAITSTPQSSVEVTVQKTIAIYSDNSAAVDTINHGRSHSLDIMQFIRRLTLVSTQHRFIIRASHIPGHKNAIAVSLSRFSLQNSNSQLQIPIPFQLRSHRIQPPSSTDSAAQHSILNSVTPQILSSCVLCPGQLTTGASWQQRAGRIHVRSRENPGRTREPVINCV
ncbi:hypothetical protein D9C73_000004 [Collichthys lucidus]|uniref:Uncharacterized protein n=1 Tax=Collichthys lucidus TaxID=240159 RepID=A0A4U5TXD7_COLLU|nr:hypothetical protein D9C73_000004 [Collichthys lucidus]